MYVGWIARSGLALMMAIPLGVIACSDDDDGKKTETDGGAGSAGSGASGGESGAAGGGGSAGQASGGAGGSAGDCTNTYGQGAECKSCLDQNCCAEAMACANSAACDAFVECGRACPDHTDTASDCMQACIAAGVPGDAYTELILCQGDKCAICPKF
jgi:hypothetical protein